MAAPTNTSAGTAIDIPTVPATITQTVDDAGTTYTVWYKYTTSSTDEVLALHGYGDFSTYLPRTAVYSDAGITPWRSFTGVGGANGHNIYFDVATTHTYYFKFAPNAGNPSPAVLHITLQTFIQDLALPRGSFLICDVLEGFPAAIMSDATGVVTRYILGFATTDFAEMLPSGFSLWRSNTVATEARRFDINLDELPIVTLPFSSVGQYLPISSNRVNTFYVARGGTGALDLAEVTTVSASGVVGGTIWELGEYQVILIAPSLDETILYYGTDGVGTVFRWDLVNDIALPDLVVFEAGAVKTGGELRMLTDGTLLVAYTLADSSQAYVKRYNSSGVLLNTYDVGQAGNYTFNRLCPGLDDPISFWVYLFDQITLGIARFDRLLTADGSSIHTIDQPLYQQGIYGPAPTATPLTDFGFSVSCPLIIMPGQETPSPTFTTDIIIPRRQRRAPHLSREQLWNFYSQFQLDLEAGVGLTSGYGSDPQIMLRWSDDGGHTWSNEHWVSAGRRGQYARRAIWRRLGRSRDRVFEVTVSDPVAWNLLAAYLAVEPGTS